MSLTIIISVLLIILIAVVVKAIVGVTKEIKLDSIGADHRGAERIPFNETAAKVEKSKNLNHGKRSPRSEMYRKRMYKRSMLLVNKSLKENQLKDPIQRNPKSKTFQTDTKSKSKL